MNEIEKKEGTLELVIYCHQCKKHFQLNPKMIAVALATQCNIWQLYEYLLHCNCPFCNES